MEKKTSTPRDAKWLLPAIDTGDGRCLRGKRKSNALNQEESTTSRKKHWTPKPETNTNAGVHSVSNDAKSKQTGKHETNYSTAKHPRNRNICDRSTPNNAEKKDTGKHKIKARNRPRKMAERNDKLILSNNAERNPKGGQKVRKPVARTALAQRIPIRGSKCKINPDDGNIGKDTSGDGPDVDKHDPDFVPSSTHSFQANDINETLTLNKSPVFKQIPQKSIGKKLQKDRMYKGETFNATDGTINDSVKASTCNTKQNVKAGEEACLNDSHNPKVKSKGKKGHGQGLQGKYSCNFCGEYFVTESHLAEHIKWIHADLVTGCISAKNMDGEKIVVKEKETVNTITEICRDTKEGEENRIEESVGFPVETVCKEVVNKLIDEITKKGTAPTFENDMQISNSLGITEFVTPTANKHYDQDKNKKCNVTSHRTEEVEHYLHDESSFSEVVLNTIDADVSSEVVPSTTGKEVIGDMVTKTVNTEESCEVVTNTLDKDTGSNVVPNNIDTEYMSEGMSNRIDTEYLSEDVPNRIDTEYMSEEVPNRIDTEYMSEDVPNRKDIENVTEGMSNRIDTETKTVSVDKSELLSTDTVLASDASKLQLEKTASNCNKRMPDVYNKFVPESVEVVSVSNLMADSCMCPFCERRLSSTKARKAHVELHCKQAPFRCAVCQKGLFTENQEHKHAKTPHLSKQKQYYIKQADRQNAYTCERCSQGFTYKITFENHLLVCKGEEKTASSKHKKKCTVCCKMIAQSYMPSHMKRHENKRNHICDICGRRFNTRAHVLGHIQSAHKQTKHFTCQYCNCKFTQKAALQRHQTVLFGKCKGDKSETAAFKCKLCSRTFTSLRWMTRHQETHILDKDSGQVLAPFKCSICSKSFKTKHELTRHFRTHVNDRPHKCTECDAAFVQKGNLQAHLRIHNGERPYICHICSMGFKQQSNLKAHMHKHYNGKFTEKKEKRLPDGTKKMMERLLDNTQKMGKGPLDNTEEVGKKTLVSTEKLGKKNASSNFSGLDKQIDQGDSQKPSLKISGLDEQIVCLDQGDSKIEFILIQNPGNTVDTACQTAVKDVASVLAENEKYGEVCDIDKYMACAERFMHKNVNSENEIYVFVDQEAELAEDAEADVDDFINKLGQIDNLGEIIKKTLEVNKRAEKNIDKQTAVDKQTYDKNGLAEINKQTEIIKQTDDGNSLTEKDKYSVSCVHTGGVNSAQNRHATGSRQIILTLTNKGQYDIIKGWSICDKTPLSSEASVNEQLTEAGGSNQTERNVDKQTIPSVRKSDTSLRQRIFDMLSSKSDFSKSMHTKDNNTDCLLDRTCSSESDKTNDSTFETDCEVKTDELENIIEAKEQAFVNDLVGNYRQQELLSTNTNMIDDKNMQVNASNILFVPSEDNTTDGSSKTVDDENIDVWSCADYQINPGISSIVSVSKDTNTMQDLAANSCKKEPNDGADDVLQVPIEPAQQSDIHGMPSLTSGDTTVDDLSSFAEGDTNVIQQSNLATGETNDDVLSRLVAGKTFEGRLARIAARDTTKGTLSRVASGQTTEGTFSRVEVREATEDTLSRLASDDKTEGSSSRLAAEEATEVTLLRFTTGDTTTDSMSKFVSSGATSDGLSRLEPRETNADRFWKLELRDTTSDGMSGLESRETNADSLPSVESRDKTVHENGNTDLDNM